MIAPVPPLPIILEDEVYYEVDKVLKHRNRKRGRKMHREYLIKWKGYDNSYNSWEAEDNLTEFTVEDYWNKRQCVVSDVSDKSE